MTTIGRTQKSKAAPVFALDDATIVITPVGHFCHGNSRPLLDLLRSGGADAEIQSWIADMIERGGFASRKTWTERVGRLGALGEAVQDFGFVKALLNHTVSRPKRERISWQCVSSRCITRSQADG